MNDMNEVRDAVNRIVKHAHPKRVILFGSHAWGEPTPDSDVDLLVILEFEGKPWKAASALRNFARASFPMDLLVRTPAQIRMRLESGDSFLAEVLQHGVTLYEA